MNLFVASRNGYVAAFSRYQLQRAEPSRLAKKCARIQSAHAAAFSSEHAGGYNAHSATKLQLLPSHIQVSCSKFFHTKNASKFTTRKLSSDAAGEGASLATPSFQTLVEKLKSSKQTCTIVESSCGGLISASLMSVPGSSRVYYGSTVAYSTKRSGKLLCGDEELHHRLLNNTYSDDSTQTNNLHIDPNLSEATQKYIRSKIHWTRETALAYCKHNETDFAIAEGGASGPTFNPEGMKAGFAVLAVAGRREGSDEIEILAQRVVYSTHADRELNMRLYADAAADLCADAMSLGSAGASLKENNKAESQSVFESSASATTSESLVFDRSSELRKNEAVLQDFYQRPDALHVIVRGTNEVLFASKHQLALPSLQEIHQDPVLSEMLKDSDTTTLLEKRTFMGRLGAEQTPLFALFVPSDAAAPNGQSVDFGQCYFANTRTRAPMLEKLHNELALTASAYRNWQEQHHYCCVCGSSLEFVQGSTCAKCTNPNGPPHFHWPRQDPSIIVLVTNPSSTHALLARSPRHPPYLYTALAGFVEAGETMESAVAREVYEEAGVTVDGNSIAYVGSQSWPFPRSCMIGFHAKTFPGETGDGLAAIHIDPKELVDAKWFEKEEVYLATRETDEMGAVMERNMVEDRLASGDWNGKLLVPSKGVLARTLMDHWLESN